MSDSAQAPAETLVDFVSRMQALAGLEPNMHDEPCMTKTLPFVIHTGMQAVFDGNT